MWLLKEIKTKWDKFFHEYRDDGKLALLLSIEIASFIILSYGLVRAA